MHRLQLYTPSIHREDGVLQVECEVVCPGTTIPIARIRMVGRVTFSRTLRDALLQTHLVDVYRCDPLQRRVMIYCACLHGALVDMPIPKLPCADAVPLEDVVLSLA